MATDTTETGEELILSTPADHEMSSFDEVGQKLYYIWSTIMTTFSGTEKKEQFTQIKVQNRGVVDYKQSGYPLMKF